MLQLKWRRLGVRDRSPSKFSRQPRRTTALTSEFEVGLKHISHVQGREARLILENKGGAHQVSLPEAADFSSCWGFMSDDKLIPAGYPTESSRLNIRKDLIKMRLSMAAQQTDINHIPVSLRTFVDSKPVWLEGELSADLSALGSLLRIGGDELSDKDALDEAEAAHTAIAENRYPISNYISSWPQGERLLQNMKGMLETKQIGLDLQCKAEKILLDCQACLDADHEKVSAVDQLRGHYDRFKRLSKIYGDAGELSCLYLQTSRMDMALEETIFCILHLIVDNVQDQSANFGFSNFVPSRYNV